MFGVARISAILLSVSCLKSANALSGKATSFPVSHPDISTKDRVPASTAKAASEAAAPSTIAMLFIEGTAF